MQPLLTTSLIGWGCGSLDQDADELAQLSSHLRRDYDSKVSLISNLIVHHLRYLRQHTDTLRSQELRLVAGTSAVRPLHRVSGRRALCARVQPPIRSKGAACAWCHPPGDKRLAGPVAFYGVLLSCFRWMPNRARSALQGRMAMMSAPFLCFPGARVGSRLAGVSARDCSPRAAVPANGGGRQGRRYCVQVHGPAHLLKMTHATCRLPCVLQLLAAKAAALCHTPAGSSFVHRRDEGTPVTARRFLSLATPLGDDDCFSAEFDETTLRVSCMRTVHGVSVHRVCMPHF